MKKAANERLNRAYQLKGSFARLRNSKTEHWQNGFVTTGEMILKDGRQQEGSPPEYQGRKVV
jgi:hypothetical protein